MESDNTIVSNILSLDGLKGRRNQKEVDKDQSTGGRWRGLEDAAENCTRRRRSRMSGLCGGTGASWGNKLVVKR